MKEKLPAGFKDFLVKSAIFFVIFILIQIATMWIVAETRLPKEVKPYSLSDLAKAAGFMLIMFIGLNKSKILKIKKYSTGLLERIVCFVLIVISFVFYFNYKHYMLSHIDLVKGNVSLFVSIEFLILFFISRNLSLSSVSYVFFQFFSFPLYLELDYL